MIGFVVMGTLIARGTADKPILFTSAKQNKLKGDWGNIDFRTEAVDSIINGTEYVSGCILEHVIVEYAGKTSYHFDG